MSQNNEPVTQTEVSALKKRLKQMSKNELIRLVMHLGNDIGFLKAQNQELDKKIQEVQKND